MTLETRGTSSSSVTEYWQGTRNLPQDTSSKVTLTTVLLNGSFPLQIQIPSGYYLQTMNSNLNLGGFLLPVAVMNVVSILPLLLLAPLMEYFSTCLFPSKRDGPFLLACISKYNLPFQVNGLQLLK